MADALTPLGELLEAARGGMSKREAARRAGISEGRWRQIVSGVQKLGGGIEAPARPRRETVLAMAQAVGVPASAALTAAGFDPPSGQGSSDEPAASESHGELLPSAEVGRFQVREVRRLIIEADRSTAWKEHQLDRLARFLEELGEWEDFIAEIRALPGVDAERAPDSEQDPLYGEERRR